MKYIKRYEYSFKPHNFEYSDGDYILINVTDLINKPDLPFAKIIDILNFDTSDTIIIEAIINNKVLTMGLFITDVLRYLEVDEIEEYELRKKSIKFNL